MITELEINVKRIENIADIVRGGRFDREGVLLEKGCADTLLYLCGDVIRSLRKQPSKNTVPADIREKHDVTLEIELLLEIKKEVMTSLKNIENSIRKVQSVCVHEWTETGCIKCGKPVETH